MAGLCFTEANHIYSRASPKVVLSSDHSHIVLFSLFLWNHSWHTIRPPDIRELMIRSTETRTSEMIHLTHTLKQTIINYTPDPTITSTFPAFIITLLCIGNICVNGHRAADGEQQVIVPRHKVWVGSFLRPLFDDFHGYEMPFRWETIGPSIFPNRKLDGCCQRWWCPPACPKQMVGAGLNFLKEAEIPQQNTALE